MVLRGPSQIACPASCHRPSRQGSRIGRRAASWATLAASPGGPSVPRSLSRPLVAVPVALLLTLTACGDDSADSGTASSETSASGSFPVTVTGADGELTLDEQPETIVSMSASATEMLFAIGAGDQVEAVDDNSNYPEDAPTTDLRSEEHTSELQSRQYL